MRALIVASDKAVARELIARVQSLGHEYIHVETVEEAQKVLGIPDDIEVPDDPCHGVSRSRKRFV